MAETVTQKSETFEVLSIDRIRVSGTNPRKVFAKEAMEELEESIRQKGILQPILVTPRNGHYELVAGERRLRAAKSVKLDRVPAVIRELTDVEVLECQIIENNQRADLDPIAEAHGFLAILKQPEYSIDRLADRIGRPRAYIEKRLALAKHLDPAVQDLVQTGELGLTSALAIARLAGKKAQVGLAKEAIKRQYSARDVQSQVQRDSQVLKDAPFDKTACKTCLQNGTAHAELFDTGSLSGHCLNPNCYRGKVDQWIAGELAKAKAAGRRVLTGKEMNSPPAERVDSLRYAMPGKTWQAKCAKCKKTALAIHQEQWSQREKSLVEICVDAACRKALRRQSRSSGSRQSGSQEDYLRGPRVWSAAVPLLAWAAAQDSPLPRTHEPQGKAIQQFAAEMVFGLLRRVETHVGIETTAVAQILIQAGILNWRKATSAGAFLNYEQGAFPNVAAISDAAAAADVDLVRVARALNEVMLAALYSERMSDTALPTVFLAKSFPLPAFRYTEHWLSEMFLRAQVEDLCRELGLKTTGTVKQLKERILKAQEEKPLPLPKQVADAIGKLGQAKPTKAAKGGKKGGKAKARKKTVRGICRECRCTEDDPCIDEKTGETCAWADAEQTLCTACADKGGKGGD